MLLCYITTLSYYIGLENSSLAEEITDHFESLNKLQKKISTALVADNNFESAMEQVKNAQSNRRKPIDSLWMT